MSRLRKLVQNLEYTGAVTYVHPYNSRSNSDYHMDGRIGHLTPQHTEHTQDVRGTKEGQRGGSSCTLFLGFELNPHWAQANGVISATLQQQQQKKKQRKQKHGSSGTNSLGGSVGIVCDSKAARAAAVGGPVDTMVAPVLNYFVATELEYQYPGSGGKNCTVGVNASYVPWSGLDFPIPEHEVSTPASSGGVAKIPLAVGSAGTGAMRKHKMELLEAHMEARKSIMSLQQIQWLFEQHQYEQQQKAAMQQMHQMQQHQHQQHFSNNQNFSSSHWQGQSQGVYGQQY